jgi:phage terminase small subunit
MAHPKGSREDNDMTPKQRAFVSEYLIDLNATQAAIRAGYSAKTAGQGGDQLLKNIEVAAAIAKAQAERADKCDIDALWVLREAKSTYEAARAGDNHSAAVSALKLVGSHVDVNAFEERVSTKHSGTIVVETGVPR